MSNSPSKPSDAPPAAGTSDNIANLRMWHDREPQNRATSAVLLARHLRARGLFAQSRKLLEDVYLAGDATPHVLRSLGLERFRGGALADGLTLYDEGRWQLDSFDHLRRPYTAPFWAGEDLAGKTLLVWAEQGIGDQVMQARVLTALLARGAKITLEADPRLEAFLSHRDQITFVGQTTPASPALQRQKFDLQTSLLSAWRFCEDGLHDGVLSIKADATLTQKYKEAWAGLGAAKNIGLSWHSKAAASGDMRSISTEQFSPLARQTNCRFHSLQYGQIDMPSVQAAFGAGIVRDPQSDPLKDLKRHFAQIAAMDLVITIDNAVAHFAGALGVPCWMILPKGSEWRWGLEPTTTTLYPSLRLFRSDDVGDFVSGLWPMFDAFDEWAAR